MLIDDSIGSGKRVKDYLKRLFNNRTIQSWWSYGLIRIVVVAFARVSEARETILEGVAGSDHGIRTYPKNSKVQFVSHLNYSQTNLYQRWGNSYLDIRQLCMDVKAIPKNRRLGFRKTMSNVVFFHSVPNNLPGVLWYQSENWQALFPQRSLPVWLPQLLGEEIETSEPGECESSDRCNPEMQMLLQLAKRGIRSADLLAWHLGLDRSVIDTLIWQLRQKELLATQNRITEAGRSWLANNVSRREVEFDQEIYIPQSWCADRKSVQPPRSERETLFPTAEPDYNSLLSGGEVGQASLEQTDAKTASPSLGVIPENPSRPRDGHDTHGPSGPKES